MNLSPYRRQPIARQTKEWIVTREDIRYGQRCALPSRFFRSYCIAALCAQWFRDDKDNAKFEYWMNDFHQIENLNKEVYLENSNTVAFLEEHTQSRDIVVTHHLPSPMSIAKEYEGNDLNRFFMCDMEDVMKERQPRLWLHGHTHSSADYCIFATRIVCNPLGYPHELNPGFHHLVIDV